MKALAALCLLLAACTTSPAPEPGLEAQLVAMEKQSWVAWQARDAAFFRDFLSDDHVEVQNNGVAGKDPVVASVGSPACVVKSYAVDHFKLTQFSADAAVLTYHAAQDTTCAGARVPSPVWATSVFVKRDGKWRNAIYAHSLATS